MNAFGQNAIGYRCVSDFIKDKNLLPGLGGVFKEPPPVCGYGDFDGNFTNQRLSFKRFAVFPIFWFSQKGSCAIVTQRTINVTSRRKMYPQLIGSCL